MRRLCPFVASLTFRFRGKVAGGNEAGFMHNMTGIDRSIDTSYAFGRLRGQPRVIAYEQEVICRFRPSSPSVGTTNHPQRIYFRPGNTRRTGCIAMARRLWRCGSQSVAVSRPCRIVYNQP